MGDTTAFANLMSAYVGTGKASELATYIVEKGKPLLVRSQENAAR